MRRRSDFMKKTRIPLNIAISVDFTRIPINIGIWGAKTGVCARARARARASILSELEILGVNPSMYLHLYLVGLKFRLPYDLRASALLGKTKKEKT